MFKTMWKNVVDTVHSLVLLGIEKPVLILKWRLRVRPSSGGTAEKISVRDQQDYIFL